MMRAFPIALTFFVMVGHVVYADETLNESKAVEKIELLGGKIARDETLPGCPVVSISFRGSKRFNDRYMHLLKPVTKLQSLNLAGIDVTDHGLKQIGHLKDLKELWLYGTQITDDGLVELKKSFPEADVYEDASEEGKAIATIERLGGWVVRDRTLPNRPVIGVSLQGSRRFDNSYLDLLKTFSNLTSLNISATEITDAGLSDICELKNLTNLNLWNTRVTDHGLDQLHELENLRKLNLGATKITDEGLEKIGTLKNLTDLNLDYSLITDAGLEELSKLENLNSLDLNSTKTTKSGEEKLKQALPKLEIQR